LLWMGVGPEGGAVVKKVNCQTKLQFC